MSVCKYRIKNKKEILQRVYDAGFDYEIKIRGCGQATIRAIMDYFEVDKNIFKSVSTCYGGISGNGTGPWGAYLAAVILLGYFFGRDIENQNISGSAFKDRELVNEIRKKFYETYGGETCEDIQKKVFGRSFNINNPKEKKEFEKSGAHVDKCPYVVGTATKWIAEILFDNLE